MRDRARERVPDMKKLNDLERTEETHWGNCGKLWKLEGFWENDALMGVLRDDGRCR